MFDHGVLQCWLRILYIMLHTIYSVHDVYPGLFSSQIVTSLVF